MPPFDPSLTPATVIINAQRGSVLVQSRNGLVVYDTREDEAIALIEQLKPHRSVTVDGVVIRTTVESVPEIGEVYRPEGDW